MDWTLIVNPGSSSKKYALYEGVRVRLIARYERTGEGFVVAVQQAGLQQRSETITETVYTQALHDLLQRCHTQFSEVTITHVGVRVVAPGDQFQTHQVIDDAFIAALRSVERHAPLHIPHTISEILTVRAALPAATHWAISDSAFHATIPAYLRRYSLEGTSAAGIKRFGYHGLSVASVVARAKEKVPTAKRVVVVHVGNGVSVSGVVAGSSCYNSMGFTPGSGVLMGSRAGDIDPGALIAVLTERNLKGEAAHMFLQTSGGFVGLTGVKDLRVVLEREARGDQSAHAAAQAFIMSIAQQVAVAATTCGGIDLLIFTGTAVERNEELRARIAAQLAWLGIRLDPKQNEAVKNTMCLLSDKVAKPAVLLVPTDEMGEMARQVAKLVNTVENK